ncbi:DUF1616 domain-containing protein [Methanolobus chelungpuianus]|uniref:DUF1616 domain-containing protein n=1 Tax=Methanolobus chelungpuianus TaxID=502115 RepID=A0AAE3HD65_9EURY|nr:DUF1616 domain-containing protein [Methanolobus chelungpuianus]MCQ6963388.1 hypothetical protein [Methanolobus chelungpuianus]
MVRSRVPGDLLLVASGVLLTNLFVFHPLLNIIELRAFLGIVMVLVLPGYAMVAALFPGKDDLSGAERFTYSIGLSVAVVPFIGYGLLSAPWGMNVGPLMISISALILVMCAVAFIRRHRLPEGMAFSPSLSSLYRPPVSFLSGRHSRLESVLRISLVFAVLISAVTVAYVIENPKPKVGFTEFYLLGPDGTSSGYPTNLSIGDSGSVMVGIVNQEERSVDYRLEILLDGKPLPSQAAGEDIHLGNDERWESEVTFKPDVYGNGMKLQFLLYKDTELSEPYRELYLWLDVQDGTGDD